METRLRTFKFEKGNPERNKVLDSAAAEVKNDTIIYCCIGPIAFMETKTKIPASSPGGFAGKMFFTKRDLQRWHEWYKKKYEK